MSFRVPALDPTAFRPLSGPPDAASPLPGTTDSATLVAHPQRTKDYPRWARIVTRDPSADGTFWYSVVTTGIYCRPSCPSRQALPRNVLLHASVEDARASGARPCKRCRPDGVGAALPHGDRIARACRMIESAEAMPRLAEIARAVGLSAGHFQRMFKAAMGLSPKRYADACQATRMREALRETSTVTEAIYAAGFSSSSRFYDKAEALLGMSPSRYRAGARSERLRFAVGQCTLGAILVASSETGIAAILLDDDPDVLVRTLQDRFPQAELVGGDANYEALVAKVVGFVEAPRIGLDLPLDIRGTAFQQRVWHALRTIPPGRTVSYAEIAKRIGAPASVRAVAGACAANMIAVAIPCHRVVRTDGALSGYRWGIERKRGLIAREAMPSRVG